MILACEAPSAWPYIGLLIAAAFALVPLAAWVGEHSGRQRLVESRRHPCNDPTPSHVRVIESPVFYNQDADDSWAAEVGHAG